MTGEFERLCALYGYRPHPDARLRGHRALRAHLRRRLRHRPEGDVHLHRPLRPLADAAPGGDRADLPRLPRARPAQEPQPQKLYTIGSMYRYGAPGQRPLPRALAARRSRRSARTDPAIDAEIIQLYDTLLSRLGVTDYRLELNSIGCRECRPAYLEKLRPGSPSTRPSSTRTRASRRATSPLRVFDVQEARRRGGCSRRAEDRRLALRRLRRALRRRPRRPRRVRASTTSSCRRSSAASTTTRARPGSSSGRWTTQNSTISGGGRYDGLAEELGGPPTPGVGFGAGIERLLIAIEDEGVADASRRPRRLLRASSRTRRASSSRRSCATCAAWASRPTPTTPAARSRAS